mgnify:FL=1
MALHTDSWADGIQLIKGPNYRDVQYVKGCFINDDNEVVEYDTIRMDISGKQNFFHTDEGIWLAQNAFKISRYNFLDPSSFNNRTHLKITLSTIDITRYHVLYGALTK